MIRQLRRWLPDRTLVVVADNSYAVLDLLACAAGLRQPVTVITRLRLDAAWYDPAPVRQPGTTGRPRKKGERQPTLAKRVDWH
jgi:DDE superfamily endonuclease